MKTQKQINWSEDLSIGNNDIDEVHKNLMDIYNELIVFIESKENRDEFALILSKMTDYCLTHFKKEEEYMKKFGFPGLKMHKNSHKDYIYKVAMYNIDLKGIDPPKIEEVIDFLEKWWVDHILKIDKRYEDYKKEIHSNVKY